jgi:hypothetical protein
LVRSDTDNHLPLVQAVPVVDVVDFGVLAFGEDEDLVAIRIV